MIRSHSSRATFALAGSLLLALASGCASTRHDHAADPAQGEMSMAHAQDDMILPPGWTAEDMQACMLAGTPGPEHERLAARAGTWTGTNTMWMAPGSEPMQTACTMKITPVFDGRFVRTEMEGEMPGMGPFQGLGFEGFDNVTRQLVGTWMDSHGTGIMSGRGEVDADGVTRRWTYTYNCPVNKGPATMRQVERQNGRDSMTLEMYGNDPKTGVEYKMMVIELTRKG